MWWGEKKPLVILNDIYEFHAIYNDAEFFVVVAVAF